MIVNVTRLMKKIAAWTTAISPTKCLLRCWAQTVPWHMDQAVLVYDQHGVFVAASLAETCLDELGTRGAASGAGSGCVGVSCSHTGSVMLSTLGREGACPGQPHAAPGLTHEPSRSGGAPRRSSYRFTAVHRGASLNRSKARQPSRQKGAGLYV